MAQVKDPVCGMTIDDKSAAATSDYRGARYFFCSKQCREDFGKTPEAYAGEA